MSAGSLVGCSVALVADHDPSAGDISDVNAALRLACDLRDSYDAVPEIWSASDGDLRSRCRTLRLSWRQLPRPVMDGSFLSWIFYRRLAAKLTTRRPHYVVGLGPHAGVGCGLLWRSRGAKSYVWLRDVLATGCDGRELRLARAWTTHRSHDPGLPDPSVVANLLTAGDPSMTAAPTVPAFDPRLVERSVFPSLVERHEREREFVRRIAKTGYRRVVVCGDGLQARVLIEACRSESVIVAALIPPGRMRRSGPLDGVPRATLRQAVERGEQIFMVTSQSDAWKAGPGIRRRALALGANVTVFGADRARRPLSLATSASDRVGRSERRAERIITALSQAQGRDCLIYGASEVGQMLLRLARRRQLRVLAFVDGNRALWGDVVDGVEVLPLPQAVRGDTHRYAIGSFESVPEIRASLAEAYRESSFQPEVFSA